MVHRCRGREAKISVFVFNFISWILGFVLIGLGGYLVASEERRLFENLITPSSRSLLLASGILIGVGIFITIVAFIGCFGAVVEHKSLLIIYICFLTIIMCAAIAVIAYILTQRRTFETNLATTLNENLKKLYPPTDIKPTGVNKNFGDAVDYFQQRGKCCGVTNYTVWRYTYWFQKRQNINFIAPRSCCTNPMALTHNMVYNNCSIQTNLFKNGCIVFTQRLINIYVPIIVGIAGAIIAVKAIGITCTLLLAITINNEASYKYW